MPTKGKRSAKKPSSKARKQTPTESKSLSAVQQRKVMPSQQAVRLTKGVKGTGLSKCAELYAKALVNPWGEFDELPCVPCAPSDLTYKFRNITRGQFSSGSASGCGFVMWSPMNPCNDVNSVWTTTSGFAGLAFAASGTGIVGSQRNSLPFASTAFVGVTAGNATARLVSSALRVKNTTAPLYRQGSLLACRLPTMANLDGQSIATLQTSLENVKEAADRDGWFHWAYIPQSDQDLDFPNAAINYATNALGRPNYGIIFQGGAVGTPASFDFEIVEFWEFTSSNPNLTMPSLTKSHSDTVGLDRVLYAVAQPPQSMDLKDQARAVASDLVEAVAHSDSVSKTVEDLLGLAGMSLPIAAQLVKSVTGMLLL